MITQTLRYNVKDGWSEMPLGLDSESTLMLVFGERGLLEDPGPIRELRSALPATRVLGCSTSGQFVDELISDEGLVATILRFERAQMRTHQASIVCAADSFGAGAAIGSALSGPDLRGVFVLCDGTRTNGTELTAGLRSVLPASATISGGLAGDGDRFEKTWVCCDGDPETGLVAGVGLYGDGVRVWHGCRGGWEAFGPFREVTKAEANVLHELDGKPALSVYEEYLGDVAREMPAAALRYPLALRRAEDGVTVVRTILGVSREDGTMTFAGDIPEGSTVQFMCSTPRRLVSGALSAIEMVPREAFEGSDSVCVSISCVGRRMLLRHRAEEELETIASRLPEDSAQVGFYSYGELSPRPGAQCELHNQTMTLTVFTETKRGEDARVDHTAAA